MFFVAGVNNGVIIDSNFLSSLHCNSTLSVRAMKNSTYLGTVGENLSNVILFNLLIEIMK